MLYIRPKALSASVLPADALRTDRTGAERFGCCALGERALYVGSFGLDCICYIPLDRIDRVYKRLAVSKGFFEGGVFGTIAYLVVHYDGGREKVCRFKYEEDVNLLLRSIAKKTNIPIGKA